MEEDLHITRRAQVEESQKRASKTGEQLEAKCDSALRLDEDRLALAFLATQDGIWDWNVETGEVFFSTRWKSMLGYEEAEIEHQFSTWERLLHPEDLARAKAVFAAAARGEAAWTIEFRLRHKSGHYLDVFSRGIPVRREPGGPVLRIVGTNSDVTERRRAEAELRRANEELERLVAERSAEWVKTSEMLQAEALQRSEEQYRLLAENTEDFVTVLDADEKRIYVSPSYYRVTGWTEAEVLSTPWNARLHPDEIANIQAARAANLAGQSTVMEHRIRCRDGNWIWVESRCKPILGEDGQVKQLLLWAHNVTERKHAEEKWRQAQKLEAIGQLAGGVAHDFNNILASMMLQLGSLQMDPSLSPQISEALHELKQEAERAAALTRQLLMFSRRSVLEVKPLDLNQIVQNLMRMLGRLIGEHICLRFESCGSQPATVSADAGMMDQVLLNLVVNARDAMPKGGRIDITTSVVAFSQAEADLSPVRRMGRFVCLAVSDSGVGMDRATVQRIFEPFFTTKDVGKGTGMGLAMVHGIVAQHSGWVEVDTEVGAGTTFRIYLPAVAEAPAPQPAKPAMGPVERGKETILLVEDDAKLRQNVCLRLRGLGYRVYEAQNGQEAMELWQKHSAEVNLLLTDMVLPEGMTGLELADRLRSQKPEFGVIISSGYTGAIYQGGRIVQSGYRYLPKPYEVSVLAATIRACLDSRD